MGHVIRIATLIHIEDEKNPVFHELLVEEVPTDVLSRWNDFINNSLISIIEKHSSCLVNLICNNDTSHLKKNI